MEEGEEEWETVDKDPLGYEGKAESFISLVGRKHGTEAQEQAQNSDPGRAHQTSEIDCKSCQLMKSPMSFFS